jgi:hypothetical protein
MKNVLKTGSMLPACRVLVCAGVLGVCTWGAMPRAAHAQGYTPIYTLDFGNPVILTGDGTTRTAGRRRVGLALGIFPVVTFFRSGFFPENNTSGTNNVTGRLVALDATFVTGNDGRGPAVDVGGWYFVEGGGLRGKNDDPLGRPVRSDAYEVHGRVFNSARREIGIQAGVLGSTNRANQDLYQYTFFAVSEYSSQRLRRRMKNPWAVQGGLGIFLDPNYDPSAGEARNTVGPTFFVSGSLSVSERVNLTISEWYVRNRRQDINRIGFGVGYSF